MFDSIRNNSKILMGLLFLLVIPSFVLFGIEGYSQFEDKGAVVARVDGNKITQSEWDAAHQQEVDRIRASVPNIDPKMLDSAEARYATLDKLVNDRLIALASEKQLLVTSDQRLARYLQQDPSIASLRGADGKLDMERYRQLAASQGMTPEMLEARVRRDLSNQQVLAGLQAVETAGSLEEATRRLDAGAVPDLIVLDLNLPDVDGLDGLVRLRLAVPDVPVLVVSSMADPRIVRAALRAGAAGLFLECLPSPPKADHVRVPHARRPPHRRRAPPRLDQRLPRPDALRSHPRLCQRRGPRCRPDPWNRRRRATRRVPPPG